MDNKNKFNTEIIDSFDHDKNDRSSLKTWKLDPPKIYTAKKGTLDKIKEKINKIKENPNLRKKLGISIASIIVAAGIAIGTIAYVNSTSDVETASTSSFSDTIKDNPNFDNMQEDLPNIENYEKSLNRYFELFNKNASLTEDERKDFIKAENYLFKNVSILTKASLETIKSSAAASINDPKISAEDLIITSHRNNDGTYNYDITYHGQSINTHFVFKDSLKPYTPLLNSRMELVGNNFENYTNPTTSAELAKSHKMVVKIKDCYDNMRQIANEKINANDFNKDGKYSFKVVDDEIDK